MPASIIEFTGAEIAPARPHALLILPDLRPRRVDGLTILVLTDGNKRSCSSEGYAGGARRVVSTAEHLARRPDVSVMIACVLSPDNIAKRGDGFFFALYKEFIHLGVEIETQSALIASGVRLEVSGDLGSLRARGGYAVALADAIEAVVAMTACVRIPDLRLILGVGYARDIARELDVDIILRTGMEEPGVLRLSGIWTGERIASCAITTLWPQVEPREVDEVIDLHKRCAAPTFAGGYGIDMIVELVLALSTAELDAPVQATIISSASPAALSAAIADLFEGSLRDCATIAVDLAVADEAVPRRYGNGEDARHRLSVVREGALVDGEPLSVLAPGQRPPLFILPDWLPSGHANVHACGTTAQEIVQGIRRAQRFSMAHPPLLGSERPTVRAAAQRGLEHDNAREGKHARDELGDRFAVKTLEWADKSGILVAGADWRTAALNYALTAFFIHFRVPTEWDATGALWEQRADLSARYMLLVAAGDEGIFDRVLSGETPKQRWARLEASSRFLRGALRSDRARRRPPRVPGADLLAVIADQWREIFYRYGDSCLPVAAVSVREGLDSLYAASLAEHRAEIAAGVLGHRGDRVGGVEEARMIEEKLAGAPPCIVARARSIIEDAGSGSPAAMNEIRALLYLAEVSSAIGAGLLFRVAALAAPASAAPSESIPTLDALATILDYYVRLANDASGFLDLPGGDRDPKENVCAILVPRSASGREHAAAVVQALATCRRLGAWLDREIGDHIDRVAATWPSMGVLLRRGVFVGSRVYAAGHYTTASRAEMTAIFDEADDAL